MKIIFVSPDNQFPKAGDFLRQQFPDISPGYLKQLLKRGRFKYRQMPLTEEQRLSPGEMIELPGNALFQQRISAGSPPILYESPQVLVVSKPSLLAVHSGVGHQNDNLLKRLTKTMRERSAPFRLHPVHRLDKETTGALLLAKGKKSASRFGQLMMAGEIKKTYLAITHNNLPQKGALDTPAPSHGKLRTARSFFQVLARSNDQCLVEIYLMSGRTHQIRRQLADAGAPLIGDKRYAPGKDASGSFNLHCRSLSFPDPENGETVTVIAALPWSFLDRVMLFEEGALSAITECLTYRKNLERSLSKTVRTE